MKNLIIVPNVQPFTLVKQADALVIEYENTCAMFATIQHQMTFQDTLTQMAMISMICLFLSSNSFFMLPKGWVKRNLSDAWELYTRLD